MRIDLPLQGFDLLIESVDHATAVRVVAE
jgi:hypothetical protein